MLALEMPLGPLFGEQVRIAAAEQKEKNEGIFYVCFYHGSFKIIVVINKEMQRPLLFKVL
jgi:hypothetical protein